jgi:hypothetical protein
VTGAKSEAVVNGSQPPNARGDDAASIQDRSTLAVGRLVAVDGNPNS